MQEQAYGISSPAPRAPWLTKLRTAPGTGQERAIPGAGVYRCACCGNALFSSRAQYDVRAKWPIFWAPLTAGSITTATEILHFVVRNEVRCSRCSAPLGLVFEDGRPPTGLRYFINREALLFIARGNPLLAAVTGS